MSRAVRIGVTGLALAAVGVGGAAIGSASTGGGPPSSATLAADSVPASTPAVAAPGHRRAKAVATRALHGVFTVERKGTPVTLDVQRGEVTRVDATSLGVRSKDGFEATYTLTPATKVRKDKAAAAASDIRVGSNVGVVAELAPNGGTATARGVRIAR